MTHDPHPSPRAEPAAAPRTILLTGGTGFVGINLVRSLAEAGRDVVATARRAPDPATEAFLEGVAAHVHWAIGDARDEAWLRTILADRPVDAVVHGAAITPTPETERTDTRTIVDTNLVVLAQLLDAAHGAGVDRLLFLSSTGVYASTPAGGRRRTEDEHVRPRNLYDACKLSGELLVAQYARIHAMAAASVRIGTVYGPLERASRSRSNLSLVDGVIHDALAGRHLRVRHGEIRRDLIHTADVGRAIIGLLDADRLPWPVFNLAGDVAPTMAEILETLARESSLTWEPCAGDDVDLALTPEHHRDPVDLERIRTTSGYVPRVALDAGLRHALAYAAADGDPSIIRGLPGGPTP